MDLTKWVPRFIVFVFVCIILWWVFIAAILGKSALLIKDKGLKNVIHDIWEGKK